MSVLFSRTNDVLFSSKDSFVKNLRSILHVIGISFSHHCHLLIPLIMFSSNFQSFLSRYISELFLSCLSVMQHDVKTSLSSASFFSVLFSKILMSVSVLESFFKFDKVCIWTKTKDIMCLSADLIKTETQECQYLLTYFCIFTCTFCRLL